MLPNPAITQLTSQAGLYHISTNLEIQKVAKKLYEANCATESKAIRNWQHVLSMAQEGMSLEPYFPAGYTAVKAGVAIHILQCETVEATVYFEKQGCYNELPLRLKGSDGLFLNETFWAHPISKILLPQETVIPCNIKLPQVYRLDGVNNHYCSYGHGLAECPNPQVLKPTSANLHDQLKNDIAVPMGAGVMTDAKRRRMQFRVFYHQYARHLENEILARNDKQGRIAKGLKIHNIPSAEEFKSLEWSIAGSIAPFYSLFGDVYVYIIGTVMICTVVGSLSGLVARIIMEISTNGFSINILWAFFQGIYHVITVPVAFIKSGYQGTVRHAEKCVDSATKPLKAQIAELQRAFNDLYRRQQSLSPSAPDPETGMINSNQPFDPPNNFSNGGGSSGGHAGSHQHATTLFDIKDESPGLFTDITADDESTNLLADNKPGPGTERQPAVNPAVNIQMQHVQQTAPKDSPDVLPATTPSPPASPSPQPDAQAQAFQAPAQRDPYGAVSSKVKSERARQIRRQSDSWSIDMYGDTAGLNAATAAAISRGAASPTHGAAASDTAPLIDLRSTPGQTRRTVSFISGDVEPDTKTPSVLGAVYSTIKKKCLKE